MFVRFTAMKKGSILLLLLLSLSVVVNSQTIRSNGTGGGNWNSSDTWVGGVVPTAANSTSIVIQNGDVVSVPSGFQIEADQLVLQANAVLQVNQGGFLDILNGAGTDLTLAASSKLFISGILEFSHGVTSTNVVASTTTVRNGGVYRHAYTTAGRIIGAIWEDGSTVEVTGLLGQYGAPTNLNQNFYNFIWNSPGMSQTRSIPDLVSVRNNLVVQSTGSSILHFFSGNSNRTLNIGGNFIINGTSRVSVSQTGSNNTVNISGSFIYSSSGLSVLTQTGTLTLNIGDNLVHSSTGTLRCAMQSGSYTNINLEGNVQLVGPLVTSFGGEVRLNFVGNAVHEFQTTAHPSGIFHYSVPSGNTLRLTTSPVTGSGSFFLSSGASLELAATATGGILQTNSTNGIIRVPHGSRVFEEGSHIIYNGVAEQHIGNGSHGLADVTLNNASGVKLVNNVSMRNLTLAAGTFTTGIYNLTLSGDLTMGGGELAQGSGNVVFVGQCNLLGDGAKSFGNVIVNVGAELNLPNEVIAISGNLAISEFATVQTNGSTIVLNGNVQQNIAGGGTVFNQVRVSKGGGAVVLTSRCDITGNLEIESPTSIVSNGNLVLRSSGDKPTVDAAIGPLPAGAAVVGNVVVQRYMGAIGKAWRFISSPVQNTLLADLKDDFKVATNSLRWYDPTMVNTPENERFRTVPPKSATYTLEVGRGYTAYMWDNKAVNLDFTGPINFGPIDLPVVRGVSSPVNPWGDGWNLVGNPYPSAIAWNGGAGWDMQNIATTVGVEVSGAGGVWNYYNFADGSGDLNDGIIATGQGFWVYAYDENPSLQINEQAKTGAKGGSFYRGKPSEQSRQLIVAISGEAGIRKAFFKLNSQATEDFDPLFDAYPIPAAALEDFGISLLDLNGSELLMHTIDELAPEREIPLQVTLPQAGHYTITFPENAAFPLAPKLFLYDKVTGAITSVSDGGSYGFEAEQGGTIRNRFLLTMTPGQEQTPAELVAAYPNPFESRFTIEVASPDPAVAEILDMRGQRLSTHTFTQRLEVDAGAYAPGVYVARVKTTQGVVIRKLLKR